MRTLWQAVKEQGDRIKLIKQMEEHALATRNLQDQIHVIDARRWFINYLHDAENVVLNDTDQEKLFTKIDIFYPSPKILVNFDYRPGYRVVLKGGIFADNDSTDNPAFRFVNDANHNIFAAYSPHGISNEQFATFVEALTSLEISYQSQNGETIATHIRSE